MFLLHSLVSGSLLVLAFLPVTVCGADQPLPDYLQDRGSGIPTSLFGTYIESGQWILYPFYEYSKNTDEEYDPREFGYPRPGFAGEEDFFGELTEHEVVLFLGYAFNNKLAFEYSKTATRKR